MTPRFLKLAHQVLATTVLLLVTGNLLLFASGVTTADVMRGTYTFVALPLIVVLIALTVVRFLVLLRAANGSPRRAAALLLDEEPVARLARAEVRNLLSLFLVLRSRRNGVRPGVRGFGYVKGALTVPMVLVGLSFVELIVVHFLIPWEWLRLTLLVATVYGVLIILGMLATSRAMNPHLVGDGRLVLKWGYSEILSTPLSNVAKVSQVSNHRYSNVTVEDKRLILTALVSTNVQISFTRPVAACPPLPRRQVPAGFHTDTVLLYVSDPDAFIAAVREAEVVPSRQDTDE